MPNKTIYVSQDDQALYDRAQQLAGDNLSAVLVRALKEFITRSEAQAKGLKEIVVQVGTKGLQQEKRFNGRLLIKWQGAGDHNDWYTARVFKTAKGQWAVELTKQANLDLFRQRDFWRTADYFEYTPDTQLLVFASIQEAEGQLPSALIKLMRQAQTKDEAPVEYLDI
ncbi:MAG TPA: EXLDI protein [Candidatus Saccharimonadia bacterium]